MRTDTTSAKYFQVVACSAFVMNDRHTASFAADNCTAVERREDTLKGFQDPYLNAKARDSH